MQWEGEPGRLTAGPRACARHHGACERWLLGFALARGSAQLALQAVPHPALRMLIASFAGCPAARRCGILVQPGHHLPPHL